MWKRTQGKQPDKLCFYLIEQLKGEQKGHDCESLIFQLGNLLPPLQLATVTGSHGVPVFGINNGTIDVLQKIKGRVQVISSIGTNKIDNITIFNHWKKRKFRLNGINDLSNGVWLWASNHPEDDRSLLLIDICPLGSRIDPFLFALAYVMSNIIVWNVEEDKYDTMRELFHFLPNLRQHLNVVQSHGMPDLSLDAPLFVCLSHKSKPKLGPYGWRRDVAMGFNNPELNSFLRKEHDKKNEIVDSFLDIFAEPMYFRLPEQKEDREGYQGYLVEFEDWMLKNRHYKNFWGMDVTIGRLLKIFETFSRSSDHDVGRRITSIKLTFDEKITEDALQRFKDIMDKTHFLEGLLKEPYSDTIESVNHIILTVTHEVFRQFHTDDQYQKHILNKIYSCLKRAYCEKMVEKLQNLNDVKPKKNVDSFSQLYDLGLPPVSLLSSTDPMRIGDLFHKILTFFPATRNSSDPIQISILTSLGASHIMKEYVFPQLIQAVQLFFEYPSSQIPTAWIGKCTKYPNKCIIIIDFGAYPSKVFPQFLPFLFLISSGFLISADSKQYLANINTQLGSPKPVLNKAQSKNDLLENFHFHQWYDNNMWGERAKKPCLLWLSGNQNDYVKEFDQIFYPLACISPKSRIPSDFLKSLNNGCRVSFGKSMTPQFFLNLMNSFVALINNSTNDVSNEKLLVRSLLPIDHDKELSRIIGNYKKHTEPKTVTGVSEINTKHKYSLERNNQSLQKYLDNATPEYRLKIHTYNY